ncbi:uncharacterized protein LOC131159799 [Malania oleifera]|uniref:uncharacterized protein LOC131159799 n=1 Tax=Malania oleifera TaxID=397392 RepID=UPI0025AEABDA|nr:uncharacterized protein LOC131159799 [Malania oleifera]
MNYKKSEALWEKGIAEKMIISNDYVGARDRLLKAQQLYPQLDHVGPMLLVCEILSASLNKLRGYKIDHYWVLQLVPSSTFLEVNCRYQKLLTLLLPLKKKFPGTELALKLLHDAFSVLSDQKKRLAFDSKRKTSWEAYKSVNIRAFCHNIPNQAAIAVQSSSSSSQPLDGKKRRLATKDSPGTVGELRPSPPATVEDPSCSSSAVNSKGSVEAHGDILADSVSLLKEQRPIGSAGNLCSSSRAVAWKKIDQDFYDFEINRKAEFLQAGQIWAVHYWSNAPQNRRYAQIISFESEACVAWLKPIPVTSGERKWCDMGLPVACGSFYLDSEISEWLSWPSVFSHNCSWICGVTEEQVEIYPKRGEVWALYKDWDIDEWAFNPQTVEGCKFLIVEILSDFSKYVGADCACLVKVDGFMSIFQRQTEDGRAVTLHIHPDNLFMFSHNVPAYRFAVGEIDNVAEGAFELDQLAVPHDTIQCMDSQTVLKEDISTSLPSFSCSVERVPSVQPCLESEPSKPKQLRNDFSIGQVWAVYSGNSLMPRQYARINSVVSERQVGVTFLEPQPILDCEINWKKENIPFVCGIFKVGGIDVNLDISQFSHSVKFQKSATNPLYRIFPMKGEIWAIYRDWHNKWKHSDYENCQCQVVEVLSALLEDNSVAVAKLVEVKGCGTFFYRQQCDGFELARTVSREEMLSFSHQIPAFRVPGIGKYGIPECSWHLEPKALPLSKGT